MVVSGCAKRAQRTLQPVAGAPVAVDPTIRRADCPTSPLSSAAMENDTETRKRSIRFPLELDAEIRKKVAELDADYSAVVIAACEFSLNDRKGQAWTQKRSS